MTHDETLSLIQETLHACRGPDVATPNDEGRIYGDGAMDSMSLVIFVAELEARIAVRTGRDVVLASERAMSRSQSPYRDVGALADFIQELLQEPEKS